MDYADMQRRYIKQKAALTRALNTKDPAKRKDMVVIAATRAVREWDASFIAWPDDWSRWQRALDDAYQWPSQAPRLESLA